jgi:DNA-binding NarL/FixJ family response regulator
MARVMIVGRSSLLRETLGNILHAQFPSAELTMMPGGGRLIEEVEMFPPKLMLIEVKLSPGNGFELTRKIKKEYPDVTVILIGSYDLPEYRETASMSGADYFISKESPVEDYLGLIRSILFSGDR